MEQAYINGTVLRWARERRGLTIQAFAELSGVASERITHWERGEEYPAFGKARDLANSLKIPFGYLFLSAPPLQAPPIPDLRTLGGERRSPSADFVDLLNDVLVKHDWYRDYIVQGGAAPLRFIGKFSPSSPVSAVVADIREVLQPDQLRRQATSVSEYLRLLSERAEQANILVMRGGVVRGSPRRALSVAEFRGFAISDEFAPLIFVNARDAQVAQVFSLAHEIVHLWIGQSGISNSTPTSTETDDVPQAEVEQFCNRAAANLLVPGEEFRSLWRSTSGDHQAKADALARRFKVSLPVIFRRALEIGHISREAFFGLLRSHQERMEQIESRREQAEEASSGGGNFYNTFFARNSRRLTLAITSAVSSGSLSTLDAARLLGVRTSTLSKVAERIRS